MPCKGICERKFGAVSITGGGKHTREHWKKCTMCAVYINYDGNRCPCCNGLFKLRTGKQHLLKARI